MVGDRQSVRAWDAGARCLNAARARSNTVLGAAHRRDPAVPIMPRQIAPEVGRT